MEGGEREGVGGNELGGDASPVAASDDGDSGFGRNAVALVSEVLIRRSHGSRGREQRERI